MHTGGKHTGKKHTEKSTFGYLHTRNFAHGAMHTT